MVYMTCKVLQLSKEPTQGIYIKNGKKYVKFKKLGI